MIERFNIYGDFVTRIGQLGSHTLFVIHADTLLRVELANWRVPQAKSTRRGD